MKRVAILTFIKVFNYGAELQAYALSQAIAKLGVNVEVLDLSIKDIDNKGFKRLYRMGLSDVRPFINTLLSKTLTLIMSQMFRGRKESKKKHFDMFYRQHMSFSAFKYKAFIELYQNNFDYDIAVVGSDQVWNYAFPFSVEPFLLTFTSSRVKKVAYAASIGRNSIPDYLRPCYKKALDSFDFISVREKTAKNILESSIGISSKVALDPTLLLTQEEWLERLALTKKKNGYLLIYMLMQSTELLHLATTMAKEYNFRIIQILSSPYVFNPHKDVSYVYDAGPKEFVELFSNASFVLTSSFHGTAFAVNFNIPFYSFVKSRRSNNSRIIDLLSDLQLSNRIVNDNELPSKVDWLSIDFTKANEILEMKREESIGYLKDNIQ